MEFCFGGQSITWVFSPPRAPHANEAIERLISLLKKGLYQNITEDNLTKSVLTTIAVKTEEILNSRPISAFSTSLDDFQAVNPNDFLTPFLNCNLGGIPEPNSDDRRLKKYYNKINHELNRIWQYFVKQMLSSFTSWKTRTMAKNQNSWHHLLLGTNGPVGPFPAAHHYKEPKPFIQLHNDITFDEAGDDEKGPKKKREKAILKASGKKRAVKNSPAAANAPALAASQKPPIEVSSTKPSVRVSEHWR